MKNEHGFTVVELLVGVFGLCGLVLMCYIIYLLISALQKYVNS